MASRTVIPIADGDLRPRSELHPETAPRLTYTPATQSDLARWAFAGALLTVLFLFSYGLMTLLIVEQGSTIQSQRTLIQQLLGDSTQLSAMKGKAFKQQQAQAPKAQAEAQHNPAVQTPSTQAAPSEKASSAANSGKAHRPKREKPPVPASDIADVRRTLLSI